jgi:DNA-binding response OmpR family regulator
MRILLVEDEHKIARAIKRGLEQESFSVDTAYDGSEGFDLASTEEYDLIILDLMIPKKDGVEVCKRLRENGNQVPILMLTAKSSVDDKILGLNTGADDYMTKPFAFEELLARVRALLRRPHNSIEQDLFCGDLSLNTLTYEVKRGDKVVELSKKEYALLEYFLRNKGKILTKDQIIAHVWNYDSDVLTNTVEQYVGYLRTKIDRAFPHKFPLIHTVRGFGYTLREDKEDSV